LLSSLLETILEAIAEQRDRWIAMSPASIGRNYQASSVSAMLTIALGA